MGETLKQSLLALLLQEVPLYVRSDLVEGVKANILAQFNSTKFNLDPYANEIFGLTNHIPFPTKRDQSEDFFPNFLVEVNQYHLDKHYKIDTLRFLRKGVTAPYGGSPSFFPPLSPSSFLPSSPFLPSPEGRKGEAKGEGEEAKEITVVIKGFTLDPDIPYLSIFYKSLLGIIYKSIKDAFEYYPTTFSTPPPETRVSEHREFLTRSGYATYFQWRKVVDDLFRDYVLTTPRLKGSTVDQGLLLLSKAFPIYVTSESFVTEKPEKFDYMRPEIWLSVQEYSNSDYGNERFTLYDLLNKPVATLEQAKIELGVVGNTPTPKIRSDVDARKTGLLTSPCDRYTYQDLLNFVRVTIYHYQPYQDLIPFLPLTPSTEGVKGRKEGPSTLPLSSSFELDKGKGRQEVVSLLFDRVQYFNKYVLCTMLSELASKKCQCRIDNVEEAIEILFPLDQSENSYKKFHWAVYRKAISELSQAKLRLDINYSDELTETMKSVVIKIQKLPGMNGFLPTLITNNSDEVIRERKNLRLVLGIDGSYEVVLYNILHGAPYISRVLLNARDVFAFSSFPSSFPSFQGKEGKEGKEEKGDISNSNVSFYPSFQGKEGKEFTTLAIFMAE